MLKLVNLRINPHTMNKSQLIEEKVRKLGTGIEYIVSHPETYDVPLEVGNIIRTALEEVYEAGYSHNTHIMKTLVRELEGMRQEVNIMKFPPHIDLRERIAHNVALDDAISLIQKTLQVTEKP